MKLRLYLGRQQAIIVQDYDNLALIISQAFSTGDKPADKVKVVSTEADMTAAMQGMFG